MGVFSPAFFVCQCFFENREKRNKGAIIGDGRAIIGKKKRAIIGTIVIRNLVGNVCVFSNNYKRKRLVLCNEKSGKK